MQIHHKQLFSEITRHRYYSQVSVQIIRLYSQIDVGLPQTDLLSRMAVSDSYATGGRLLWCKVTGWDFNF